MCLMISLSAMCICNIYFIRKRNRIVYIYTGALSELPPMFDGTKGHSPTTPQAYVFSDLLTLVSCDIVIVYQINKCLSKQMFTNNCSKKELTNTLGTHIEKGSLWIVEADEAGYVDKISVNNSEMTGEEFRKQCNITSGNFTIEEREKGIVFTIKGEGHGYGLSQYGANRMAGEGKNYEEILKYYFSNIQLHSV